MSEKGNVLTQRLVSLQRTNNFPRVFELVVNLRTYSLFLATYCLLQGYTISFNVFIHEFGQMILYQTRKISIEMYKIQSQSQHPICDAINFKKEV